MNILQAQAIDELQGALELEPGHARCALLLDALAGTGHFSLLKFRV